MISEVSGDILKTGAQVIAHGIAPGDPCTTGLALQLREHWPSLHKDLHHYCHTQHPKPGTLWTWMGADGKRVVNLFTQEPAPRTGGHPGHATLTYVGHALRELHKLAVAEKFTSIALPRLATGVGGLDWKDVEPLIRQHLGELGIPVIVYSTYRAGQAAQEKL